MEIRKFFCNACKVNFEIIFDECVSEELIRCSRCKSFEIKSKSITAKGRYAGCPIACPAATPGKCSACPNRLIT